jgi:23S rRNA (adenine2030-N6)-methyltransferase
MLSYQHEYHAGNHGDVLKHSVLVLVLEALQRKEGALRVLDSHAGSGLYDLTSREARRHAEHEQGIARLLAAGAPPGLRRYLDLVRDCNAGRAGLARYPGSPWIARRLLRPADHLVAMELHPRALVALRRLFARDGQVHIHARDAFEGLPALVPPPERRGLVLIDPSYEVKEDFARVAGLLAGCYRRWPGGCYLIWYPLIRHRQAERFPQRIAALGIRKIYQAVLEIEGPASGGMRGSGVLVVNLPWGLEATLGAVLPALWKALAHGGRGGWQAGWLVPE